VIIVNWAENIRKLREKMLLTQSELAQIIGVSFASVNRYENDKHEPTMKVKRTLKKLFIKYDIIRGDLRDEK